MTPDLPSKFPPLLPDAYPSDWIETVRLREGTQVLLRPIRPDDAHRLQEGFQRLSPRSIYLRFLEPYKELPGKLAQQLANLDYNTQMALVAETYEESRSRVIGVARYAILDRPGPRLAESAIVVVDEFQQRGLGRLLMNRLTAYAISHGIDAFLATVHHTNGEVLRFIEHSGLPVTRRIVEPGIWEIQVTLKRD
jgi:acetyltransferase